jgi:OFA family oxalate/formate antiporter-like MFS transporter
LAVAGSALALFWPGAFAFGLPGVLGPHWQETFGVGRGAVGAIIFFMLASLGVFMFLVGRWQERLGPGVMIAIGGLLAGLSVMALPFASSIHLVYVWAFVSGTSSSFIMIPALTVVQRWYPKHRGLMSGLVNLVFGSAGAIMSPLFAFALGALGYRNMNLIAGALAVAFGLAVSRMVALPEIAGAVEHSVSSARDVADDEPRAGGALLLGQTPVVPSLSVAPSLTVGQSLRTRNFWLIWAVWALQGAACVAMVSLSVSFGVSRGFAFESAVGILTAFNVTNGLSRILTGYFSDRIHRQRTMAAAFLAAGLAYLLLPHVNALGTIAMLAAVVGFGFGTLFAVSAPLAVDCFGIGHFGAVYGLIFTAYGFVAGGLGPLLGGTLADSRGGYPLVFGYLGALCLVSAALIQFVRPPRTPTPRAPEVVAAGGGAMSASVYEAVEE